MQDFAPCKVPVFAGTGPKLFPLKREIQKIVLVMKITAVLLLAATLQVSAKGWSQEKINLSLTNAPLEQVFNSITSQTNIAFFYRPQYVKDKKLTINVTNASLMSVLELCLKNQHLTYEIIGKAVVIRPVKNEKNNSISSKNIIDGAPPLDIKGRVVNEKGEPVSGVTVKVKGGTQSTLTDENGEFSIITEDKDAILVFTHVSMEAFEVKVSGNKELKISLKTKVSALDELQVIAYGTTTKRLNTGNVATVKATEIEKQPVSNPLQALQGRVPGMIITQNTGVPGGSFSVEIRGQNSINFSSEPLYIIDGVPYASQLLPNVGVGITSKIGNTGGNPLNYMNPGDIESIEVLKDADATAIYGSRAANGVVLITTKKGKAGKTTIDARVYFGGGKISRKLDLLNREQYLEMRREAYVNDNATPASFDRDFSGEWDTTRYTDWQKEFIGKTARYTDAQLSVAGGTGNTKYLIAGTYHKETTVFPGNFNSQKAAVHFNLSGSSTNQRFTAMLSGIYVNDNSKLPRADMTQYIFGSPVAPPIYKEDGSLNWQYNSSGVFTFVNPAAQLLKKYNNVTNNIIGNVILSYQVLPGLYLRTSMGYTNLFVNEINTIPIASVPPTYPASLKLGSANFVDNNIRSSIIEPQATYQVEIGKGHLNALVGSTFQKNYSKGQIIAGSGYTSDLVLENIRSAPIVTVSSSTVAEYKYNAIFGRLNYNWQQRYIANFTLRRDGSSRFGPENKFHNFYATGAAWLFSNENFIKKNAKFLSFGKIRGSYGTTGNDQIGDYKFFDLYNTTTYTYQSSLGLYPGNLFNPELAWEETKKLEAGIELGFLQDKIFISISAYRNRSSNQLLSAAVPTTTGFSVISTNLPALIENKGFEFALSTKNISTKKFTWRTNANLTISRNELKEFPNFIGSGYEFKYVIGQPLSILKLYDLKYVDPSSGIYQFGDGKGGLTTRPDTATKVTSYSLVNTTPKFYGGFQNTFQYGNFELDIFFQFVKQIGQQFLVNPNFTPPGRFSVSNNQPVTVLDRWQKANDKTMIQKYSQKSFNDVAIGYTNMLSSNLAYADASFIRLKNISLSYQLPASWRRTLKLQGAKFYLQGQNLLTITNYKGFDPENQTVTSLPPLKVLTFGVNITL